MADKVQHIETQDQAKALMYFLTKERQRHLHDVCKIDRDRDELAAKWKLEVPTKVADIWWQP